MLQKNLFKVVGIDKDKCVNCHLCINACPVKFCNDGSGDVVAINDNMCIACGSCLAACTHDARYYIDDFEEFINDAKKGQKMVAIVAPAVAANFPKTYLHLNGWLKSLGVEAIFDVSFGAELTIASYLEYIKKHNPKTVITQPCAAIVSYIEIFKPELLKYLAPVDSPMVHTMKLIRNFYKQYKDHKIVVLSPCMAKKREFEETGYGDYNVSFISTQKYLSTNTISLESFPQSEYDNPPAERAVLFSTPGGLLQTAERWIPEIRNKTRKIEGVNSIYEYFEKLPSMIEEGKAPLLIDCLNCEKGCNGGPLTLGKNMPIDEVEYWVSKRNKEMQEHYKLEETKNNTPASDQLETLLMNYWNENLYARSYQDISENCNLKIPNEKELKDIYIRMHKYSESDIYNCSSCGYIRCEKMATAIFNGLNKPENCHFYLSKEGEIAHNAMALSQKRLQTILNTMVEGFVQVDDDGEITHHNPALIKILKTANLVGRKLSEFLDEQNNEIFNANLKLREQHIQSTYEVSFLCEDKSTVYCIVNGCPFYDEGGNKTGSFGIITDITLRKNAENALQRSRDELEDRVIERTKELSTTVEELKQAEEEIVANRDAIEEKANSLAEALDMLKNSQDKLIESEKMVALGQLIAGVAHEINTPLGAIRSSVGNITNTLQQILTMLPNFFRSISEEEKNAFFDLLDKSLKATNSITSKEERTAKRQIVQQLDEYAIVSSENIADILVDMCIYKDIDQFLVLLKSERSAEIFHMAYKLSGLLRSSQTIAMATDRASKVVFALKNFAHYDNSGEMIKADIIFGIETILTLYGNQLKQGINVIRNFNEIPQILCYPDELNQVWTNLVHNAIQAMDNKGDLTIDVSCNQEKVLVCFTDTGKGIPAEIKDKIFKPFFTTKPQGEGSGLGLDIVRRIVEKHKGEISVESKPGKTTFIVELN